jgi:hypothetical protein
MSDNNVVDLTRSVAFAVTDPSLITINPEELARRNAERRKAEDAARPPVEPSALLRGEYEDLLRRVQGQPTEAAWKNEAEASAQRDAAEIKVTEDEITFVQDLLKSPGLSLCPPRRATPPRPPMSGCRCDVCLFELRIVDLQSKLELQKRTAQKHIRTNGAQIANARELDKLRPRLAELGKIFNKIDAARKNIRGLANTDLAQLPIAQGDGFRSRHIQWENNTPHQK